MPAAHQLGVPAGTDAACARHPQRGPAPLKTAQNRPEAQDSRRAWGIEARRAALREIVGGVRAGTRFVGAAALPFGARCVRAAALDLGPANP